MTEVVEAYREYAPTWDAASTTRCLLGSVAPELLGGLWRVVLTNSDALQGSRRRTWSWARGKKIRHVDAAGLYHQEWHGEPAWIEVFVDRVTADAPSWALRFQAVREGLLGAVLYHELGHHLHKTQRPEHRERELIADEWAVYLLRIHMRQRHRFTAAALYLAGRVAGLFRRVTRRDRRAPTREKA